MAQDDGEVKGANRAASGGMKNHFIPCFYTKRWALDDGKLTRFTRPAGMLIDRKRYPAQVGFQTDLYTLPGIEDATKNMLETSFFSKIDQQANDVLAKLESHGPSSLSEAEKGAWTVFLISLRQRNRDALERIARNADAAFQKDIGDYRRKYNERELQIRGISFDQFIAEIRADGWFERTNKLVVQGAILLPKTTEALLSFCWDVFHLASPHHELLTSDRPLIMTDGLAHMAGHLALPIGPRKLFVATRDVQTMQQLRRARNLAGASNEIVVRQACEEVYATSCEQRKFIDTRFRQLHK